VRFADPDSAVQESIRELGLSEAATDIDETVRASKVADSNVRETVEERVRTLLEDDPETFESAPDPSETDADGSATAAVDETDTDVAGTETPIESADTDADVADHADATTVPDAPGTEGIETDAGTEGGDADATEVDDEAAEVAEGPGAGDGQSSMEEYL
jgi:hypothetical protein